MRHRDGTGRLQSVGAWSDPFLLAIIRSFYAATGVPMVLNTSFNVMGRPMVHDVEDAVGVFLTSDIDVLVVGGALFRKEGGGPGGPGKVLP
ncbi:Decarbamoylnovobiocin carbamoyltransferase [Methylobacterium adhaesivum]|uniref:Carbamoyltransferase C-terminal domain-containing protein n=1 Tax=Methylobacterium adhaesivum TaxID=333297 RepID=A0ABT8BLZ8_9HYPH|nr:carbamoyltransferase C-terminal domain-containing protein [Methylobacterium adhaesivum]MDN3592224.1 carbamoyltransferase C-terminal domain-containing protein [Methylobacterium adhaesivum]GJD32518.1 Decarbamoylnovobiocin carbamoyltransferase [Methylobacterium adhaesivum]